MAFLPEGNQFFTCNDLVARDSADKNIMAWDFNKAVVLSNQIYQVSFKVKLNDLLFNMLCIFYIRAYEN